MQQGSLLDKRKGGEPAMMRRRKQRRSRKTSAPDDDRSCATARRELAPTCLGTRRRDNLVRFATAVADGKAARQRPRQLDLASTAPARRQTVRLDGTYIHTYNSCHSQTPSCAKLWPAHERGTAGTGRSLIFQQTIGGNSIAVCLQESVPGPKTHAFVTLVKGPPRI